MVLISSFAINVPDLDYSCTFVYHMIPFRYYLFGTSVEYAIDSIIS